MKISISIFAILFSLQTQAQSEGPYRTSSGGGHLAKPAQIEFSDKNLAKLKTSGKYKVQVFAKDLKGPRMMVVAEDGAVYVSRPKQKDILVLRDADGDGVSESRETYVSGLDKVHGMAMHEGNLYYVAMKTVYVSPMKAGAKPKVLIEGLPDVGQHENRALAIGPDKFLYVSIASNCNACVDPNKKMATMQKYSLDGKEAGTFASGLRDTIGFDWDPVTGKLYGMDHGTDWRGDKIPPEEFNLLEAGKDYGWPHCWGDKKTDDNLIANPEGQTKAEFCKTTEAPKLMYDAHAAPIGMRFYQGEMFPELKGSALVAMHGSWNRSKPVGYKVVKVAFKDGQPQKFEDFLYGFLSADGKSQIGRPAGVAFLKDGSILVSEDSAGVIYRISRDRN